MKLKATFFAIVVAANLSISGAVAQPTHGIAMHGKPALPADFKHLPYANPDAPKGGTYRIAVTGGFDTLNPLIIKGRAAAGLRVYVFESLLARNRAEPFSLYGLIAEKVEVAPDRSAISFYLNKAAKFSDGTPITTRDVRFSYETLREKGRPNHRSYYGKVQHVIVDSPHKITFKLSGADRELVLILGLMPIISADFYKTRDFTKTTLEPVLGSGPYVIEKVSPGERIVYRRNKAYWAKDLPISRGLWNFDEVRFEYFRDTQSAREAFGKGLVDVRFENDPGRWSAGYDFSGNGNSKVVKETIPVGLPKPTGSFVFNTRRAIFADKRVREALVHVFDFEWANKNLFHNLFFRTQGFYTDSVLSSIGRKASPIELDLLKQTGAKLAPRFLDGSFKQPVSDGTGRDRARLRHAVGLLAKAGWHFKGRTLTNAKTGQPFRFELITRTSEQEKIALHYQRSLRQIGITVEIRKLDSAQFQQRLVSYDYDMVPVTWYNSLSPGNEQSFYWGSAGRKQEGTRNYMGAANPAIDAMITKLIAAQSREDFTASVRALDRLLVSGFYIVPLYYTRDQWMVRWSHIKLPKTFSLYGYRPETAWFSPD